MPKVSVIIPTYNLAHYVCQTIDSVLEQTYKDYEIIVVDDGSTDNTREILSRYSNKIRYFYKKNEGEWSAINKGIGLSKGEYIAFVDADDLWLPEKLKLQVDFLEKNPDYGIVYSDAYLFDKKGIYPKTFLQKYKDYSGYVLDKLCLQNYIAELTTVVKKECFEKVGLYDANISLAIDYDIWLRIAGEYKFGVINTPLAKYRCHETNMSRDSIRMYQGLIQSIDKAVNHWPHLRKVLGLKLRRRFSTLYFNLGCAFFKKKKFKDANKAFGKSIICWPLANFKNFYLYPCSWLPAKAINKLVLFKEKIKFLNFA